MEKRKARKRQISSSGQTEVCLFFDHADRAEKLFEEAVRRLGPTGISFSLCFDRLQKGVWDKIPGLTHLIVLTDRMEETGQTALEGAASGLSGLTFFCDYQGFSIKNLSFLSVFGREEFHTYPFSMQLLSLPEWQEQEQNIPEERKDGNLHRRRVLYIMALLLYGSGVSSTLLEACDKARRMNRQRKY